MLEVAEQVRKWGGSTSIALLDPACKIFKMPDIEGVIGYKTGKNCVVALGDPVCNPSHILPLVSGFHDFCREQGLGVVYAAASERFAKWAMKNVCLSWVQVGEELILDPHKDPLEGAKGRKVRNKISHCQHAGVAVSEYLFTDKQLERKIESVSSEWLKAKKGPQIYLANVNLFESKTGKRWFYAHKGNEVVGALLLNQLEIHQGWLINLLMATPNAPSGTSEMLVIKLLEVLRQEGCTYVSFGGATGNKLGEIVGLGKCSQCIAHLGFQLAKWIFPLDARQAYWKKFHPTSEKSYLLFSKPHFGLSEILSVMKAMNVSL